MWHSSVNGHDAIRIASLADRSTGRIRATPVTVANGQTIRVAAIGITVSGEAFANSSSLSLKWELSGCEGLAYWADVYEPKGSKSSWERFLVLQNESGQVLQELDAFKCVHIYLGTKSSLFVLLAFLKLSLILRICFVC